MLADSSAGRPPPTNPKTKAEKKPKPTSKMALDLVSKGALRVVDADSLYQQCIQNNVCLGLITR